MKFNFISYKTNFGAVEIYQLSHLRSVKALIWRHLTRFCLAIFRLTGGFRSIRRAPLGPPFDMTESNCLTKLQIKLIWLG